MKSKSLSAAAALGALLGSLLIFGGCSSTPPKVSYDAASNPIDEINKLDHEINEGFNNHFDVLDEQDFRKAQNYLKDARDDQAKGEKQEKVLATLGYSRAYLDKTKDRSTELQERVRGILDARTAALKAGIRSFPAEADEFSRVDDDFRSEVGNLDKGKMSSKRWSELQAGYFGLELRAIQDSKLGQANAKIEGAKKNGAEKNAPNTLKAAEFDLQNARNVIATERYNDAKNQPTVDKANHSAEFLIEVLAATKQPGGRVSEAVATNLVQQGRQIKNLDEQVAEQSADALSKERALASQTEKLKSNEAALSLDQALKDAHNEFSSDEADVYRQGDKLLIRLKGVNFASGRSELPAQSLPLLTKVKDITQKLNPQQVVIEGHTDSTGTPATNMTLSQSRADAVASYFENNGIEKEKVEAIGYGYKKPLVTNKTKVGRATNRRVDIIITPTNPEANGSHAQSM